jgi:micrococcal nuclease
MNAFVVITKKRIRCSIGLMVLIILAASVGVCDAHSWVTAKWVADGDTIILTDGRHVRYIGIDTPEIDHKNHRAEPMGHEARTMNRELVDGWRLRLVYDREKTDRYGRTLAYVYRSDGLFVNAELLRRGYAHVLYRFPNTSEHEILLSAQRHAMVHGRGIWQRLDKDGQPSCAYPANRRSRRFHAHDCPMGKRISQKNRIWLKNQWAGFWSGYAPAGECIEFPPP